MDKDIYVYIMCHVENGVDVGPVKVGYSSNPSTRVENLQCGNPRKIRLYKQFGTPQRDIAKFIEGGFHHMFADKRLAGEWFDLKPEQAMGLMAVNFIFFLSMLGFSEDEKDEAMKAIGFEGADVQNA